jgi:hypothetical protein
VPSAAATLPVDPLRRRPAVGDILAALGAHMPGNSNVIAKLEHLDECRNREHFLRLPGGLQHDIPGPPRRTLTSVEAGESRGVSTERADHVRQRCLSHRDQHGQSAGDALPARRTGVLWRTFAHAEAVDLVRVGMGGGSSRIAVTCSLNRLHVTVRYE